MKNNIIAKAMLLFIIFSIFSINFFANASVVGAAHNETQPVDSSDCHSCSLWWDSSPSDLSSQRDNLTNAICMKCHDGSWAPFVSGSGPDNYTILYQAVTFSVMV